MTIITNEPTDLNAVLAAHELCGQLITQMPDGMYFAGWEIMPGYVGGQYSIETSDIGAKRALVMLANQFGLVYDTEEKAGFVQIQAAGEIDGIQVLLWAHVNQPGAR